MKKLPDDFSLKRADGVASLIAVGTEWCGYCKRAKPVLREVEKLLGPKNLAVYWLDADKDTKGRAEAWGVEGYPTIFYKTREGKVYRFEDEVTFDKLQHFMCLLEKSKMCTRVK